MISPPRSLYFPNGTRERERERKRSLKKRGNDTNLKAHRNRLRDKYIFPIKRIKLRRKRKTEVQNKYNHAFFRARTHPTNMHFSNIEQPLKYLFLYLISI